jgi:hypothetical protein
MNCVGLIRELERRSQLRSLRRPRLSATAKQPAVAVALARRKVSFMADQRGAVAFEMLLVYLFMIMALLLPLSDVAAFGFQFISAWDALRAFGQYVQYNNPPDPTNTTTWQSGLTTTTVAGYTISNIQVMCGDANTVCSSGNVTLTPKYYSYTTTVTLAPMVLSSVLCTSSNTNHCSYTLPYSERFQ